MTARQRWTWIGLAAALAVLAILGVAVGTVAIPPGELWAALGGGGDPSTVAIVRSLRLPRVVLGALVGAALGAAGAALQGTLRNALAEPYLLGVSGGAAVGAVTASALGTSHPFAVPLAAFVGAVLAIGTALGVARAAGGRSDPKVLLMAGVIVGAFANAVIMVALAGETPDAVRGALWWMMGSLSGAVWPQVGWLAVYTAIGGMALMALSREIDVLSLGEEPAAALGADVARAMRRVFVIASLLAAASVSAAGLVGFVGLVVPHLVRAGGLRRHLIVLPASAIAGAALVIAADLMARTVVAPAELPLGAVTALIGVPFFLLQLRRLA